MKKSILFTTIVLAVLLCGCDFEPPFRCSKCRCVTRFGVRPVYIGKTMTMMPYSYQQWVCDDKQQHRYEEAKKDE